MLKLITASTVSVIALTTAKNYLRVDHTEDDELIAALVKSSIYTIENASGLVTTSEGWQQTTPGGCSEIDLYLGPISSIDSVTYYDDFDSTGKLLTESVDFRVVNKQLINESGYWSKQRSGDGYVINYTVGAWDTNDKRLEIMKTCALRLTGWLYENREEYVTQINEMFSTSYSYDQIPEGIKRLLFSVSEDVGF